MSEFIVILCTVPSRDDSVAIAKRLVEEGLAACVNINSGVSSIYKWKGDICNDEEYLLFIKSRKALFDKISAEIVSLHPYDLPEIISLPITDALKPYLNWIEENTQN